MFAYKNMAIFLVYKGIKKLFGSNHIVYNIVIILYCNGHDYEYSMHFTVWQNTQINRNIIRFQNTGIDLFPQL